MATSLPAQRYSDIDRADALLAAGRLVAAENIYYDAARQRPRDPATRRALGRYLAARGALRIGAVLLEEARYFGGDKQAVAADLAPVYAALGDYRALTALPAGPLSTPERRRAEYLAANAPAIALNDSAVVPLTPATREGVGDIPVVIDLDTLIATIDPATTGLVLDTSWARRRSSRLFGSAVDARRASGVVSEVNIGSASLRRVPARYTPMPAGRARIGPDILATLTPTIDEKKRQLILRAPRARVRTAGDQLLTFTTRASMLVTSPDSASRTTGSTGSVAVAIDSPMGRALLAGRRWTWIARAGVIWVER